jgi:DNA-binding helix-hairpin-helix protein with protein kinase domain
MIGILSPGEEVRVGASDATCRVERLLGAGGQGEVYRALLDGQPMAVKWYYEHTATSDQHDALKELVDRGTPDPRFLWPQAIVTVPSKPGFGYVMALRDQRFAGIPDLLTRRVMAKFKTLASVGVHLADGFRRLHAKGLCYRDISDGNVFFDPLAGEVLICDNDNVGIEGQKASVRGTPRYMAPEVVRLEAEPSTQTDLYSLAVLQFLLLVNHHPLDGKNEAAIHSYDANAVVRLYGTNPIFIFDPDDGSNAPEAGLQDNALLFWPIYPTFMRDLFTRAFTVGLRDPHVRVRETEWRTALSRLRDAVVYCACGAENFYDVDALQVAGAPGTCWRCRNALVLPPRIRIGKQVVMLNHDSALHPHHLDDSEEIDFSRACAEVAAHPSQPGIWGLRNRTNAVWATTGPDGSMREVAPGRSVALAVGTKIQFGKAEGEVRL